jgi:NAD(P)H dehydrogenase (quinone)
VRVRHGNFADPTSLLSAFEGATQVLVVSASQTGGDAVAAHRSAIDAAVTTGAQRVLYTSHMGASLTSLFAPMPDHATTEAILAETGVAYTSLRNGFYASTVMMLLGHALQTGELAAPHDGPVAWTAHADLAEIAAIALADGGLDGLTPALTGSDAIDMTGIAALASELSGREIRRTVISDNQYKSNLIGNGAPASAADMLVGLFQAARHGDFAPTDPTLARLLGRTPASLRDVMSTAIVKPS